MISVDQVLVPGLQGLEFENWKKLFEWPGNLIHDSGPSLGHEQDAIHQMDVRDWSRTQFKHGGAAPFPDRRNLISTNLPNDSLDALRDEHLPKATRRRRDALRGNKEHISRPNLAAAFESQQGIAIASGTPNNTLERLGLKEFGTIPTPTQNEATYFAGAEWALQVFTVETLGFKLIQVPMLESLKVAASCQVAIAHAQQISDLDKVGDFLKDVERRHYAPLNESVSGKLAQINAEIERWTDAATIPVLTAAGQECRPLTLVNISTSLVGIGNLKKLSIDLFSFGNGVTDVCGALGQAICENKGVDLPFGRR